MTHIILLLYLISGFSGITSIIYLIMKYGNNTPYMKGYIGVHLSYTFLMIASLIVMYLRVNVIKSPIVMSIFIAVILLCMGILCRALSRFSFIINTKGITDRMRPFWKIMPFFFVILSVLQFILWDTKFTLYPVISGVTVFVLISIRFSIRNSLKKKNEQENIAWIFFLIFTLIVISVELILKFLYGFLGEYTINIPIIFLCWNFLTMAQFKNIDTSDEIAGKWDLTAREIEITKAILSGDSNKEIASDLNISFSTVKNHIYNIYRKTGAKSRVDLVNLLK
ncbi:MAG: helix-turn-helix transcriptional regulator [Spirochaetaceae bacterium]|jgi:DNA-binding CsgD family transcriptional regulator|nr:helix-turn-helix transcriptional regulator [Spirochaetaceae bacterium]